MSEDAGGFAVHSSTGRELRDELLRKVSASRKVLIPVRRKARSSSTLKPGTLERFATEDNSAYRLPLKRRTFIVRNLRHYKYAVKCELSIFGLQASRDWQE